MTKETDPKIYNLIEKEISHQRNEFTLISSENYASPLRLFKPTISEIRFSAVNLLREAQRRIRGVFNNFEFKIKEDGSEYAIYTGKDSLV